MVDVYINNSISSRSKLNSSQDQNIFVDTLYPGCNIGGYSCIAKEDYTITGIASSDTTVLVLKMSILEKYINNPTHGGVQGFDLLYPIHKYIQENGMPYLDYKLYRSSLFKVKPVRKLQQGVRRIMRILKSVSKISPQEEVKGVNESQLPNNSVPALQSRRETMNTNLGMAHILTDRHKSIAEGIDSTSYTLITRYCAIIEHLVAIIKNL